MYLDTVSRMAIVLPSRVVFMLLSSKCQSSQLPHSGAERLAAYDRAFDWS